MKILTLISICIGCWITHSSASEDVEAARHVVEREIRFYKDASVGVPFYFISLYPVTFLDHESDPPDSILKYSNYNYLRFPVLQKGKVVQSWCVSRSYDEYQTCGMQKAHEYLIAFLKYRDSLGKGYELAELFTGYCGLFWVIHKDLVAKEVIPVDREAWRTMTGRSYRENVRWRCGRRYEVIKAVFLIRQAALEHERRFCQMKGVEPVPESPPDNTRSPANKLIGKMTFKVIDQRGERLRNARIVINGFDVEARSTPGGRREVKRLPAGQQDIVIAAVGYDETRIEGFPLSPGVDTTLTVTMRKSRVEVDDKGNIIATPKDKYKAYPTRPRLYRGGHRVFSKACRKWLPTMNEHGLEFNCRYDDVTINDTTYVTAIATVTNYSLDGDLSCGAFSFITQYKALNNPLGGRGGSRRCRIPRLEDKSKTFESAGLLCEIKELGYTETASDTLRFHYRRSRFEEFFGEMEIWFLFYYGENGDLWERSRYIDLGRLLVPVGRRPDYAAPGLAP